MGNYGNDLFGSLGCFPSSDSPSWESSPVTASVPAKIKLVKEIALVFIAGGICKNAETRSYVGLRREGELLPDDKKPAPIRH